MTKTIPFFFVIIELLINIKLSFFPNSERVTHFLESILALTLGQEDPTSWSISKAASRRSSSSF